MFCNIFAKCFILHVTKALDNLHCAVIVAKPLLKFTSINELI